MSNGNLRKRAIELIESGSGTQQEKLDLLLQITLDNIDAIEAVRIEVNANPLAWIPPTWRRRVAIGAGGWIAWVSVNVAGIPLSLVGLAELFGKLK
jgi:hypothetical protein